MSQRKELISFIFTGPEEEPPHVQGPHIGYQTPDRGGGFRSHMQDVQNEDHQLADDRERQDQHQTSEAQSLKSRILYLLGE